MGEQYLCKAKRLDNGEWIKGYLVPLGKKSFSDPDQYGMIEKAIPVGSQNNPVLYNMYIIEVDPQTVCWCVGLPDKNSKEAFEGDIIRTPVGIARIIWNAGSNPYNSRIVAGFEAVFMDKESDDLYRHDAGYWLGRGTLIGNIFDNPELLGEQEAE